jgi:hypothetical protein
MIRRPAECSVLLDPKMRQLPPCQLLGGEISGLASYANGLKDRGSQESIRYKSSEVAVAYSLSLRNLASVFSAIGCEIIEPTMAASDCFDESRISPVRRALSGHHDAQFGPASFELGGYKASDCQLLPDKSLELRVKQGTRSSVI